MYKIEHTGTTRAELMGMARRLADWTPMSARFRAAVRDYHKARSIPGETGALQADLQVPSVWRVQPLSLEYGTSLGYAEYYAQWRRDNGLDELVLAEPASAIGAAWAEYVATGRT